MNNTIENREISSLTEVTISGIARADDALTLLDPVHATLTKGNAPKLAGQVERAAEHVLTIKAICLRENATLSRYEGQRITPFQHFRHLEQLRQLDVNGNGRLDEVTPEQLAAMLAVEEAA